MGQVGQVGHGISTALHYLFLCVQVYPDLHMGEKTDFVAIKMKQLNRNNTLMVWPKTKASAK